MSAGSTDALGYIYQQLNIYLEITEKKAKSVEIFWKKEIEGQILWSDIHRNRFPTRKLVTTEDNFITVKFH
jgi:hypothetical protein